MKGFKTQLVLEDVVSDLGGDVVRLIEVNLHDVDSDEVAEVDTVVVADAEAEVVAEMLAEVVTLVIPVVEADVDADPLQWS